MATNQSSTLTGALGAVLGYVGSEVAELTLFERLYWPERYYNDLSLKVALQQAFLMTMGGPLHAAALKSLDTFRKHGLYLGTGRGNMLGTAFYADRNITYSTGLADDSHSDETRNAFWVEVVRSLDRTFQESDTTTKKLLDSRQDGDAKPSRQVRSVQTIYYLELGAVPLRSGDSPAHRTSSIDCIREDSVTWKTFVCILLSEVVAIGVGIGAIFLGAPWMAIVMAIPLLLKTISATLSVRREGLSSLPEFEKHDATAEHEIFNIYLPQHGFLLVVGPATLIHQFFRHYGHPVRNGSRFPGNRFREVIAMVLLYCFVLYFPAGLTFTFWLDDSVQYLWLAYQLYAVLAMHVVRLLDWQGTGRTEERVAKSLSQGKTVWLQSLGGTTVSAKVKMEPVLGIAEGKKRVQDMLYRHYGKNQGGTASVQHGPLMENSVPANGIPPSREEPEDTS